MISLHKAIHVLLILLVLSICLALRTNKKRAKNRPPRLRETVPYITNAWHLMTNQRRLINRMRKALQSSPVVQCQLGPMNIFLVSGASPVSTLFRSSFTSDPWILHILRHTADYAAADLAKFPAETPRYTQPKASGEDIFQIMHSIHKDDLGGAEWVQKFASIFQARLRESLSTLADDWTTLRVSDLVKGHMATSATKTLMGTRIFQVNPKIMQALWAFEPFAERLAFGLPRWLNRDATAARDRLREMCGQWFEIADREYDWEKEKAQPNRGWEPIFGSPAVRNLARWAKRFGFSRHSFGAVYTLFLFGLHANTGPVTTWMLIEIAKDHELCDTIRKEVARACTSTGEMDTRTLTSLPLLQSVYTEILRMHVSFLITRTATENVVIEGCTIPKGYTVQAPTEVAHFDENIWGKPDHPASQFWAYRHVKEQSKMNDQGADTSKQIFSVGSRGGFFPFGGGVNMCPGINIAKAEVLLTVATVVTNFDVEFFRWLNSDGTPSEREARDQVRYAGSGGTPPDREMEIRIRRRF